MNDFSKNTQAVLIIEMGSDTFYEIIRQVTENLKKSNDINTNKKWISLQETKSLLQLKSSTSIQKLRDNGSIRFTKFGRNILYDSDSIEQYLEKNANETF